MPTASITPGGVTTFCQGNSVMLTASAATSYLWSNSATTQSITTSTSGNYSVTVTDGNGCSASSSPTTVTVNTLPAATAGSNSPVCEGNTLNLTSGGGTTYNWSGPNSFASTSQNPSVISVTTAGGGTYTVTVTNASGCTSIATTTVIVSAPVADAGPDQEICEGGTAMLNASGGLAYIWSNGAASASTTVSPTTDTTYTVTVYNVRIPIPLQLL
ncbi:MAG: immunoglobulin domain-containing protein [Bacteroidia bacterium]|nr:immunoglobulin domain-containing protein [Bacteroidia bacterium]